MADSDKRAKVRAAIAADGSGEPRRRRAKWLAVVLVLMFVATACGSDSEAGKGNEADEMVEKFDANGDGVVTIGVAAAGPADDGAYYQAVVDAAQAISTEHGFSSPIVVDEIQPADAATALGDLAAQVDIVIVGSSDIAESLGDLTEEYSAVFWYCNCGAGFPVTPGLAQSLDDGSEIAFTAGVATALLLEETGKTDTVFIGCCDLGFEREFLLAFELGLTETVSELTVTYVPSGGFGDVLSATEALNNAVASGSGAVMPYLGDAHRPVVAAANRAGIITMSAGSSTVCDADEELAYDIAVRFDGGDYLTAIFPQILGGDLVEGETKVFKVGIDPEPGAMICNPTAEQTAAMDDAYSRIATGEYVASFDAIKAEAYSG